MICKTGKTPSSEGIFLLLHIFLFGCHTSTNVPFCLVLLQNSTSLQV